MLYVLLLVSLSRSLLYFPLCLLCFLFLSSFWFLHLCSGTVQFSFNWLFSPITLTVPAVFNSLLLSPWWCFGLSLFLYATVCLFLSWQTAADCMLDRPCGVFDMAHKAGGRTLSACTGVYHLHTREHAQKPIPTSCFSLHRHE